MTDITLSAAEPDGKRDEAQSTYRDGVREGRFVYFIQGEKTGLIKIGLSILPLARMATFQALSPDKLTLLAAMPCRSYGPEERMLHRRFAAHRRHGEWFEPAPEILAFIQGGSLAPLWSACGGPAE